jgi:WD40 repeat protein
MFQEQLLHHLQQELPKNSSLIEAVALALEISYDAAHRRVSLKSKFSLDEGIVLAKYYNLSLDRLFETTNTDFITVEKTKNISNEEELTIYLEESYASLTQILNQKDCKIIYSAKDIPLFYTISDDILSQFKLYVWLKLLDPNYANKSFENFTPSLSLSKAGKQLANLYNDLNTIEIWDITTINSTLKQIYYYFKAGQIQTEKALEICTVLKKLTTNIALKLTQKAQSFLIYYNELHLMNNHVLVSTPNSQLLYVPFTLLSYYKTTDKSTCDEAKKFINKQLQESKLLNTVGEKERNVFINKMIKKIDALYQIIEATQILDFE